MINFSDKKVRKVVSAVIIIVIVLAMVGTTIIAGLSM